MSKASGVRRAIMKALGSGDSGKLGPKTPLYDKIKKKSGGMTDDEFDAANKARNRALMDKLHPQRRPSKGRDLVGPGAVAVGALGAIGGGYVAATHMTGKRKK